MQTHNPEWNRSSSDLANSSFLKMISISIPNYLNEPYDKYNW